jgi:hypothetical protein
VKQPPKASGEIPADSPLVEGVDYFLENGNFVFTSQYLLRRGYCCGSGCRNCPYLKRAQVKIVSMVPSWTETLLYCKCDVVGRTRFCIHPAESVQQITVVGGTKDIAWEKVRALKPDLLLLDQEENPRAMAEDSFVEVLATHVTSVNDVAGEIERIAKRMREAGEIEVGESMNVLATRWARVAEAEPLLNRELDHLPGLLEWLSVVPGEKTSIVYVIWKKPYMAVAKETFIASVLEKIGIPAEQLWPAGKGKYPEFEIASVPTNTLMLFASEPYPFAEKKPSPAEIGPRAAAIVDGECFSWFGLRTLIFLEKALGIF